MAASSSVKAYDVFLSFRGEDTRNSFTDHLYKKLTDEAISTFRDNEGINIGEELDQKISRAIKESKGSIVVLSPNYATSTWCLDELWLILKQRRDSGHFVIPIFYHVDPSDVRKQNKAFNIQVKTSSRWTEENVNKWKDALREVADLKGSEISGPETKFLKVIVDFINQNLDHKDVQSPPNLIGMTARYEEISSWLNQSISQFLTIYGMGGSGKTTLAEYIYESNRKRFENRTSFIKDITRRCEEHSGLFKVQEELFNDILGGTELNQHTQRMSKLVKALKEIKTFIVLDDIGDIELSDLLGYGEINAQSKIIITNRTKVSNWFHFLDKQRCQHHEIKLLNDVESSRLLSLRAFGNETPKDGFEELVLEAVHYCEGNPLALNVLASSLESNTIKDWRSQLSLLEKDIDDKIQGVLIKSYMSLPEEYTKKLFLHIACFFVGEDMDYVEKILELDYAAVSGIKSLTKRYLLSVSSNKKLSMHRLIQEMGRKIVRQESFHDPAQRSRVWDNHDSFKILRREKGSETIEGLALDMRILAKDQKHAFKSLDLKTDALNKMDNLKLLQLNFVKLTGSYENFSEDLRWLCWHGYHQITIPFDLFMGNMVALDMSNSKLEIFEPPMHLQALQILNLKDSNNLLEIRNISRIPNLETFILWNCHSLVHVCETIEDLKSLALLNMTGCENLCKREEINLLPGLKASSSSEQVTKHPLFSIPISLEKLFLNSCNLECTELLLLSFSAQQSLLYLNLSNNLFEFLPCYDHLENLRVLDLSFCKRLKWLLFLPSTLAELYVYYCESLEKITFQSHRFTLQEFGYGGCINLSEIEDFLKLVPIAKLDETDLGHLKWLKKYQSHEVLLVGDDELTKGRCSKLQMLYEFNILSTSLLDIKDSNMTPDYISESSSLSFVVPACPKRRRLKGLNVIIKYTLSGEDSAWFATISTTNGDDLIYNPKVFGKPGSGEVATWLSYWPIGNTLEVGDNINVSIVTKIGLKVHECGASLVYAADEEMDETMGWVETLGGCVSRFQLSTGAYYLCRRDFFELMEAGRPSPAWFRVLVGDTVDYTEIQGWRKTGRLEELKPSSIEVRTVRCIIHGPEQEEFYKIAEMSKSSFVDKTAEFTSSILGETMESGITSEISAAATKGKSRMSTASVSNEPMKSVSMAVADLKGSDVSGFCSEVEEGGFLSSLDLIQDAYEANLETSNPTDHYKVHQNFSGFQVLAFNCLNDYTTQFLNGGFDLVSSEDHEVIDFIVTKVNPSVSINEAAVRLFEGLFVELKELENQLIHKSLVVTGRSLGGYIAILFTLWLQQTIDEKQADGIKGTKRPICITFGCPLVGNEALQKAISQRPQWKSCFLNVVAKTDPVASFYSSNSLYKPFGTTLFCTESGGHTVFKDQESVLAVLDAMASSRAGNTEIPDYGNHLKSIQRKILYRGVSELGKFNSNSLRAGIALQFSGIGYVLDDNLNGLIRKTEEQQKETKRKERMKTRIDPSKKLNKAKISMACMEYHMNLGRSKGGYYDNYKNPGTSRDEIKFRQEMETDRLILNQYWKETIQEKNLTPIREGGKLRKRWLYGGNTYRKIVEPLDIAEHYKPNGKYYKNGNKHYLEDRPKHYQLLEKWMNEDKKGLNPNERGNKAASLNEDSCFWAHVEEALILLKKVKNEGANGEKLVEFESYVMSAINKYSLSPDVFLKGSSLMKWWDMYKQHKGSSYASELAIYMNNGRYTSYK